MSIISGVKNRDTFATNFYFMRNMRDINFSGKKVLIRVDFNVPLDEQFNVKDATRIEAAVPTINKVLADGGRVILMSHLGRPKGQKNPKMSLKHIVLTISDMLNKPVGFVSDCIGNEVNKLVTSMNRGDVLLLENLRFYKEETEGNIAFAKELASIADFYINDAFGTAHRAHASTAVISQFFKNNCCYGSLMDAEIKNLNKVLKGAKHPNTAIVGGAKVSSKIDILYNLINRVDNIIIGGGMAYTFILAKGGQVGNSLVEVDKVDLAKEILVKAKEAGVNIALPVDSVNASEFSNDADIITTDIMNIPTGYLGLDIGMESVTLFSNIINDSKTILWNGPMGVFEMNKFSNGTVEVGKAIVEATKKGAFSLVGGGDSVAAAKQFGLSKNLSYVSTGGGAMLEFLEGKKLPGISAILDAN